MRTRTQPDVRAHSSADLSSRPAGAAALVQAATFLVGFALYGTAIAAAEYGEPGVPVADHVAFLVDNQVLLGAWYAVIYLVFGVGLAVLVPALHDRLRTGAPILSRTAAILGLVWVVLMFATGMTAVAGGDMVVRLTAADPAAAEQVWRMVALVIEGFGGGIELVGGLWLALLGIAGLRTHVLPRALNGLAVVTGVAGVASLVTIGNEVVVSVFGAGCIVWFVWVGTHLLRRPREIVR